MMLNPRILVPKNCYRKYANEILLYLNKAALKQAKKLFYAEADAKKSLKEAQDALNLAVLTQYPKLSMDDTKSLIVDDKWLATLQSNIMTEIESVTQQNGQPR